MYVDSVWSLYDGCAFDEGLALELVHFESLPSSQFLISNRWLVEMHMKRKFFHCPLFSKLH